METLLWTVIIIIGIFILSGLKVVNQYERGVMLTLGKFTGIKQPGLRIVIPIFQRIIRVDIRSTPIDVPKQEIISIAQYTNRCKISHYSVALPI